MLSIISAEELAHVLNWSSAQKAQHTRVFLTTDVPKKGEELFLNFRVPNALFKNEATNTSGSYKRLFIKGFFTAWMAAIAGPLILFLQVPQEPHLEARTSQLWLEFDAEKLLHLTT